MQILAHSITKPANFAYNDESNKAENEFNRALNHCYEAWVSHCITKFNSEYLTRRYIFPFCAESLAPDTTQYPGVSSGPLIISVMSTYFWSLGVCTGAGNAAEYVVEPMVTSPGFGWPLCPFFGIKAKTPLDLLLKPPRLEDWSHSGGFWRVAPITLEKRSRKRRHFFSTCNWAPVTMERLSSDSTGAVQTYEKQLHFTFLWKLQLYESQDK